MAFASVDGGLLPSLADQFVQGAESDVEIVFLLVDRIPGLVEARILADDLFHLEHEVHHGQRVELHFLVRKRLEVRALRLDVGELIKTKVVGGLPKDGLEVGEVKRRER